MRAGSFKTFEKRFEPVEVGEGVIIRERCEIPEGTDPHLVWTVVDCDGKTYLAPGWHLVNRLGFVLCKKPYTDEESIRDYVY